MQQEKINEARLQDKTLFDFDEDLNQLDGVQERYPTNFISETVKTEKPAPSILNRFQVKRAERPAMPQDVLEDLAKMKQKNEKPVVKRQTEPFCTTESSFKSKL